MLSEGPEGPVIGRHRVIGEMAGHDLPQPFALRGNGLVHSSPQLHLDLQEFRSHAVPSGLPLQLEVAAARLAAYERETQEVESFRFADSALRATCWPRNGQTRSRGSFPDAATVRIVPSRTHRIAKAPGVSFVFEARHDIIRIPQDDHVARGLAPSPALSPEVERIYSDV